MQVDCHKSHVDLQWDVDEIQGIIHTKEANMLNRITTYYIICELPAVMKQLSNKEKYMPL